MLLDLQNLQTPLLLLHRSLVQTIWYVVCSLFDVFKTGMAGLKVRAVIFQIQK